MPSVALGVPTMREDEVRVVDIRVSPALDLAPDVLLLSFDTPTPPADSREEVHAASEPAAQHLERELERTKYQLRDIVEQHEVSIEELKASNEGLQAMTKSCGLRPRSSRLAAKSCNR